MRSTWIDLNLLTSVFIRERQRERRPREDEAEIGGMWQQAKDAWSPQKLDKAGRTLPGAFRESVALPTPRFGTSGLQNSGRISFCCLSPPVWGTL